MIAFEIAEDDEFDPTQNSDDESQSEKEPEKEPLVNQNHVRTLLNEMEEKGVKEEKIIARYGVKSLEEMTVTQFMDAMKGLEATKPVEKVDLGL
jgi:hypothetical protein